MTVKSLAEMSKTAKRSPKLSKRSVATSKIASNAKVIAQRIGSVDGSVKKIYASFSDPKAQFTAAKVREVVSACDRMDRTLATDIEATKVALKVCVASNIPCARLVDQMASLHTLRGNLACIVAQAEASIAEEDMEDDIINLDETGYVVDDETSEDEEIQDQVDEAVEDAVDEQIDDAVEDAVDDVPVDTEVPDEDTDVPVDTEVPDETPSDDELEDDASVASEEIVTDSMDEEEPSGLVSDDGGEVDPDVELVDEIEMEDEMMDGLLDEEILSEDLPEDDLMEEDEMVGASASIQAIKVASAKKQSGTFGKGDIDFIAQDILG